MTNRKRLLSLILAAVMVFTLASPAMAVEYAYDYGVGFTQVSNDRITEPLSGGHTAHITPAEPAYEEDEVLRVSIFLEKKGTIDAGYSPMNIADSSAALAYNQSLKREQEAMTQKISKAIGRELDVVWNLTLATNLISANVEFGQIADIEALPGVACVVIENRYDPAVVEQGGVDPNMATSGTQTGAFNAWAAGYTGAGSRVAIIDTGLDVEHEAFNAGAFTYALGVLAEEKGLTTGDYIDSLDLLDVAQINKVLSNLNAYQREWGNISAAELFVNDKVAFGYNYVDGDLDLSHYNSEHGSHVAGISAANTYIPDGSGYAPALTTTAVQGVASDAQLLIMKVFSQYGAYDSDIMASIEDAVLLGADVVNLSLGSNVPGTTRIASDNLDATEKYQTIMENLEGSGVVVAISAGNNSHWAESAENGNGLLYSDDVSFHTGGSPGTYTNSLGVASADNAGYVVPSFFVVTGNTLEYMESLGYGNPRMSTLGGNHQYIYVNSTGTEADFQSLGRELLEGKIVLCNRGGSSFAEKANAAAAMGAAGVVVVNTEDQHFRMDLTGYKYDVPVASIPQGHGWIFQQVANGDEKNGIQYWTGTVEIASNPEVVYYDSPYTMSAFSSWGVPGSLEMKPEITAPGGWIYNVAGAIPGYGYFTDHASYELMSGTSMAAPQVAGMSAVLAQFIRETGLDTKTGLDVRTLAQSLLMSTAVPMVDPNNTDYSCYYPVIQQGAGLANVGDAILADSYILMDANATDSWADGKVKVELGDDPDKTGVYTFSFTIHNLTDMDKTFTLSADFFTQALAAENELLATWTRPLAPEVAWTVGGKAVENGAALAGMDFDGNGAVNHADGQALLDYAAGVRRSLTNMDKADLNGDGKVGSYDSYLFFAMLENNGALVPAGGSATVTVTVTMSQEDHALLADYPVGAYLQGFVFAESLATEEGLAGTSHSIPVLGFYGNWSDASMYDKGSAMEYIHYTEDRMPYLYDTNYQSGNYNGLIYTSGGSNYWFGGNPVITDETYMPERNAFSAVSGDMITMLGISVIRNAGGSWFFIRNAETGEYYEHYNVTDNGPLYSSFYYPGNWTWENGYNTLEDLGFDGTEYPNNTRLEIGLLSPLEYYMDEDGNVDWDALGEGAEFSMPLTIDNEVPVVHSVTEDKEGSLLNVQVSDNQHIAAVVLYESTGSTPLAYLGSQAQAQAGDTLDYTLDIASVNGSGFLLAVYDYAGNVTVYELDMQIGETVDRVDYILMDPVDLTLQLGTTAKLTAQVYPTNSVNRGIVWSSANEEAVTVDQEGNVTAVGTGSAYIFATSTYDPGISAYCYVEVVSLGTTLNAIVWEPNMDVLYVEFDTQDPAAYEDLSGDLYWDTHGNGYLASACVGPDGTIYAGTVNQNVTPFSGCLYTIDPDTYEVSYLNSCYADVDIFYSDMTYAPAMFGTGMILASYGPYVFLVDPDTGECEGYIDQFSSDILGITTVESYYYYSSDMGDYIYEDVVLLTFADGTVILEDYYGYGGGVVPYYDYFEGTRYGMTTGIDLDDSWLFNSAYFDGSCLYWAAFNTATASDTSQVTLYAIDVFGTGDVFNMGQFGSGVWPVGGLHQKGVCVEINATNAANAHHGSTEPRAIGSDGCAPQMLDQEDIIAVAQVMSKAQKAMSGSGSTSAPMSEIGQESEDRIVVELTAADATGSPIDSTNGVFTVTYDPAQVTLVGVQVNSQYSAWDAGELSDPDGIITIGYVDLDTIAADETIVKLEFQAKSETVQVTVDHVEVNDTEPGWQEVLTMGCFHDNMTRVPAQAPTCTESGNVEYWLCPDCGKCYLDAEGTQAIEQADTVIPAAGHTWGEWEVVEEPTEEASGQRKHTCTDCGETEYETIPPTGVLYGDCNDDGKVNLKDVILLRQYLAGWDVEINLQNANVNGDTAVNLKDVILLRQYLAGWDVILGPELQEDNSWIVGEWVNITRTDRYEEALGAWVGRVEENYYIFNEDGTGVMGSYEWTSWDLNNGVPGDTWMLEGMGFFSYDFTYTLEGDRLTINLEYYDDTGDEPGLITETKVYIVTRNADGSVTRTLEGSGYDTVYRQVEEDTTMEEKLELFGLDPNVPEN